jgi:folate-binding protein YgfZ
MAPDALFDAPDAHRDAAGVIVDYGDHEAECRALLEAAALVPRPDLCVLRLEGASALELLHNVTTQALQDLAIGTSRPACLLTPKGRILGCFEVVRGEDALLVLLPREALQRVQPVLARYGMLLDVEVTEARVDQHVLELIGPISTAVLEGLGLPVPAAGAAEPVPDGLVLGQPVGELPGYLLWLTRGAARRLAAVDGVALVGHAARERLRLDVGLPRDGAELTDAVLFNEAGLEDRVSWNKGCYPGQEPVVMAKHRGHPPRRLCHLHLSVDVLPPAGTSLSLGGREVGVITSAAPGLRTPASKALAYVRHGAAEAGAELSLPGGGSARIDRLC